MRVQRVLAVAVVTWWAGGGLPPAAWANDVAKPKVSRVPAYQAVKTSEEAVARISELGGRVRYLSAKRKVLVVDLRFVVKGFSDEHLQYIPALKDVVAVQLKRVAVTDAGLKYLVAVSTIEDLDLSETAISDAGLKTLAVLSSLKTLNLFGTAITDNGLRHLETIKTLRRLFVDQTRTSVDGVARLKSSNAELTVVPDRPATRRSIEALVKVAKKLLAESETVLAAAAKDHDELTPKVGELKKVEDTKNSAAATAKKASDAANKAQAEAKKAADAAAAKLKAAREKHAAATKRAAEAKAKSAAAKKAADKAKRRHARAREAKPAFDLAKRIQVASTLRLVDARRRQVLAPGAPFEPRQDKLPAPVPAGATVLFDGTESTKFLSKTGQKINWPIQEGGLVSTKGGNNSNHIVSSVHFRDAVIHVEFLLPAEGSGNSGVYIHGNYELQIIRSHGKKDVTQKDMGALYGFAKPLVNAARKPGEWQVYDILYEAPRRDGKMKIVKKGTITAWLNGQLVQRNTRFGEPRSVYHPYRHQTTPYLKAIFEKQKKTMTGPVFLQDHGHKVRFRNVWVMPLDDESKAYEPPAKKKDEAKDGK